MSNSRPKDTWLILTQRYGADVRDPTDSDIAHAVDEVYRDTTDIEHGDTWMRYGLPDGRMFVLTLGISGTITLEEYGDQDSNEKRAERTIERVAQPEAERLFQLLRRGDLERLSHEPWTDAA